MVKSGRYTLESGLDIPVADAEGGITTVKSDDAYEALNKDGARLATPEDRSAWEQRQQDANLERVYGDTTGTAVGTGFLRGATLGVSDIAIPALAGAVGADSEAVRQGLVQTKNRQLIASGIGEAGGMVAQSLVAPVGPGIGALGEQAGAAIASPASRLVQSLAPAVVGGATEGAYWGLGNGISEAALGKPEDVASNLVAGVTLGGLTGGAFGAAMGGAKLAKPFLSKAIDTTASAVENTVKTIARKTAKRELTAAASEAGDTELADMISKHGLIDSDAGQYVRELYMQGDTQGALSFAKEAGKQETALRQEAARLETGARNYLTQVPKDEAAVMQRHLEDAAYDAVKARNAAYQEYRQADDIIRQETATLKGPAVYGRDIVDKIDGYLTKATESGDKLAASKAAEVKSALEMQLSGGHVTEGQEINGLRNIKESLKRHEIGSIANADGRKAFLDIEATIADALGNHPRPFIADTFTEGNKIYQAVAELGKMIGKQNPKMTAVNKLLINDETRAATLGFAAKLGEYAPELKAFADTVNSQVGQREALQAIRAKLISGNINSPTSKISIDDIKAIVNEFGLTRGGIQQRLQRIDTIQNTVNGLQGLSPMEQAVHLDRAIKGGPSTLERYLPYEKQFAALGRLKDMKEARDSMLQRVGRATVGGIVGGPKGAALGYFGVGKTAMSPATILKTLNKVEKMAYTGTRRMANAMTATVEAATGPTMTRASRIASGVIIDHDRFNAIKARIQALSSPDAMAEALGDMDATATPQLHSAISQKIIAAQRYLQQTLPKDPLDGYSLKAGETPYKPSDLDLSRYMRRVEAVNDPVKTIERVGQGIVTNEEIDALKNVHPEIFNNLRTELFNGIINATKPVAYQNRLMLKQVFGIPTDYSLRPEFLAQMQQSFAPADQGGRPQEATTVHGETKTQAQRKSVDIAPRSHLTAAQLNESSEE